MRAVVGLAALIGASLCGAQAEPLLPTMTQDDEIVDVREVPIDTVLRVTRADGNVFYVSADYRWVITGDVIDMWTGKDEHELQDYARMRWERTGTTPGELALPGWQSSSPEAVVFVSQQCAGHCDGLSEVLGSAGVAPIPYGPLDAWAEWGWIWCEDSVGLDILESWRDNEASTGIRAKCDSGDLAGRAMALARIFQINPTEPVLIDQAGRIVRGKKEIEAWSNHSEG